MLEVEVDRAALCDLRRGTDRLRPRLRHARPQRAALWWQPTELLKALEVVLAVRPAQVATLLERLAVANAHQHVLQLTIGRQRVVRVVGHDQRQAQLVGERDRFGHEPVVVREQVMLQLEMEVAVEHPGQPARGVLRPISIAGQQPPRDLAVATAGQGDEPLRLVAQARMGEARRALGPGKLGPASEPAQAAIAGHVARDEHQMRPELARPNAAQVLAHGIAVARRPQPLDLRTNDAAVESRLGRNDLCGGRGSLAPAPGNDDAVRIRGDGIEQLDFHAHDGVEPCLVRGRGKADSAIQAQVIGQRETGQPEIDGALDEILDARRAVEEREVGVAMELGVGTRHEGDSRTDVLISQ